MSTCVDTVTKLPQLSHTTCRRSHDHEDGVTVSESRIGAVDAKLKLRNSKKLTLSQRPLAHLLNHIRHDAVRDLVDAQAPQHSELLEAVQTVVPFIGQRLHMRLDAIKIRPPRLQMVFEVTREALEIGSSRNGADLGPHPAIDPAARVAFRCWISLLNS